MYSNFRNVQILIALMKEYGIRDVVLSPGGSDIPIIHSIETDEYFECYSVVDERSAAYYALGLAIQKNVPVACVCTSGTAVCNYVPGITEAYYQKAPVLAITADKNPYYQDQLETQKINQKHMFDGVIKKAVDLPLINNTEDEWLCNRLVNEALIELNRHGTGPVHINIPVVGDTGIYNCEILPKERCVKWTNQPSWSEYDARLKGKKIMVVVGQNVVFSEQDTVVMESFFERYDCFFATEHLSNLNCKGAINTYPITEMHSVEKLLHLKPDVIISIGNNLSAYNLKPFLRASYKTMENWLICEDGNLRDAYKCLTDVIEMSPVEFFRGIIRNTQRNSINSHAYFELWLAEKEKIVLPEFEFSNLYVAKRLAKLIPEKSIVHTAILNSTRIMQFFDLQKDVKSYSNVGALGIDGCLSTFAGQAVATEELAFLIIGDLSFFYDMNAAGLRSIGKNVRIVLLNNGGGSEFQFFMGKRRIPTLDRYICAEHDKVAAGWIASLGYDYYSAENKEEFEKAITEFIKPSELPMFLEVFTDMEEDAERTNEMYDIYRLVEPSRKQNIKRAIGSLLPQKQKEKVKKILKILKE